MTLKELLSKIKKPLHVTLYDKEREVICDCKSESIALRQFESWIVVDFFPHFIPYNESASLEVCIKEDMPFE